MLNLTEKLNRFISAISRGLSKAKDKITSVFNKISIKTKDYFYQSLLFWEQLAQKMDMWYDYFSNKLNQKAENVGNVAKPVFNTTYFFGEAAFAFYSTLQFLFSMAPVVLPLIAIINIPFFGELSSPLINLSVIAISCLAGYFKYTSLQYQNSQDEQISINKEKLEALKSKHKKQKGLLKELKDELKELKGQIHEKTGGKNERGPIEPVKNLVIRRSTGNIESEQSQGEVAKTSLSRKRSHTIS